MAYRLTDASALGLDLARTPGGVGAAGVLLRLLLVAPDAAVAPGPAPADLVDTRAHALRLLGPAVPTVVDLTAVEDAAPARAAQDPSGPLDGVLPSASPEDVLARRLRRMVRRLGSVSFGTVGDLLALTDELAADLPEGIAEVAVDAVTAELVRARDDVAAPVLARALGRRLDPAAPARPLLPVLPEPGRALLGAAGSPLVTGTTALLSRIAAAREDVLLVADRPGPQVWAEHMHVAAWAVEATGRTRLAAAAQLELLRCLDAAGVGPGAYLGGVWNTCSGAVQAQVVVDVLPAGSHEVLCADLLRALPG